MVNVLKQKTPTARKEHRCDNCESLSIKPGDKYHRNTCLYDGRVYDWVSCQPCEELFEAVWDWSNQSDFGIGPDDYEEWSCEFENDPAYGEQARAYRKRRFGEGAA